MLISPAVMPNHHCSVRVSCADSLVVPPVQIEEASPPLRGPVQHRENAHERDELARGERPPLLHHQVAELSGLLRQLGLVFGPPVAGGEEGAAAFQSGAVQSHGDDHEQSRREREEVNRTVGQQQPPVQLHLRGEQYSLSTPWKKTKLLRTVWFQNSSPRDGKVYLKRQGGG